jgi:ArsR family transcriptional regulator
VVEERGGGFSFYRLSPALLDGGFGGMWPALQAQFESAAGSPEVRGDEARLHEVIRLRKENFDVHGTDRAQFVPGRSWAAWSRALGLLLPPVEVVDIACGEGYLSVEAARWAKKVIGIDRSREVLKRARALAERRGVSNITWKRGEIERLPLGDGSADVCAALSGAASCAGAGARNLGRRRASFVPAATWWCSICASTIRPGSATGSAIAGWASKTMTSGAS